MSIIEMPLLNEIEIGRWFSTNYTVGQESEIDCLIENHVWVTARRVQIHVRSMSTSHIKNCIRCWNGQGNLIIPQGYLGGRDKWLAIFAQELVNRQ